jgi:hypothetical protein
LAVGGQDLARREGFAQALEDRLREPDLGPHPPRSPSLAMFPIAAPIGP